MTDRLIFVLVTILYSSMPFSIFCDERLHLTNACKSLREVFQPTPEENEKATLLTCLLVLHMYFKITCFKYLTWSERDNSRCHATGFLLNGVGGEYGGGTRTRTNAVWAILGLNLFVLEIWIILPNFWDTFPAFILRFPSVPIPGEISRFPNNFGFVRDVTPRPCRLKSPLSNMWSVHLEQKRQNEGFKVDQHS